MSLAFWGCNFGSRGEVHSLKDLLLFLPPLSRTEHCPCGSVPHRVRWRVAGAMDGLFPLGMPGEPRGSWDQGAAPNRATMAGILPIGAGGSAVGGTWKPRALAWSCLKGFCQTFHTDAQRLQLNCCRCWLCLLWGRSGLASSPLPAPRGPAGCAALRHLGGGSSPARRRSQRGWVSSRSLYNAWTSPLFATFSSSEKTTNFYLPLGMAFLFLGVLRQQVWIGYVHYQNRGFYHEVIALRLQCTRDETN